MSTTLQAVQSVTLYYREGRSDKVYQVSICESGSGFVLHYAYGRRGHTLTTGTKTKQPVSKEDAEKLFAKLVKAKQAKGYQPGEEGASYQQSALQDQDSGIRCQLLNPIEESEINALLMNTTHCLQEKLDGRRLLVRKLGHEICGINRRGLFVGLADTIRDDLSLIPGDFLMDGEAIGDTLHAFDLLEINGDDLRQQGYFERHARLIRLLPTGLENLRWAYSVTKPRDKYEIYHDLLGEGKEGVVFKDLNAPYTAGRPNSGGSQLKYKFYETASLVVVRHNTKRSVSLGLHEPGTDRLKSGGNVTIPANHGIPPIGAIVEVRYLYAFSESGVLYQPTYLGPRTDIPETDCTTAQLKYKPDHP